MRIFIPHSPLCLFRKENADTYNYKHKASSKIRSSFIFNVYWGTLLVAQLVEALGYKSQGLGFVTP